MNKKFQLCYALKSSFYAIICAILVFYSLRILYYQFFENVGYIFLSKSIFTENEEFLKDASTIFQSLNEKIPHKGVALVSLFSGEKNKAVTIWNNYQEMNPEDEFAILFVGKSMIMSGKNNNAQNYWLFQDQPKLISYQAQDCYYKGDSECAVEWVSRSFEILPESEIPWFLIRRLRFQICDPQKKETGNNFELCNKINEINYLEANAVPCSNYQCYLERGLFFLYSLGFSEVAYQNLSNAEIINGNAEKLPQDLINGLIFASCETSQWNQAIHYVNLIYKSKPMDINLYLCWANALLKTKNFADLLNVLSIAKENYPNNYELKDFISKNIPLEIHSP